MLSTKVLLLALALAACATAIPTSADYAETQFVEDTQAVVPEADKGQAIQKLKDFLESSGLVETNELVQTNQNPDENLTAEPSHPPLTTKAIAANLKTYCDPKTPTGKAHQIECEWLNL